MMPVQWTLKKPYRLALVLVIAAMVCAACLYCTLYESFIAASMKAKGAVFIGAASSPFKTPMLSWIEFNTYDSIEMDARDCKKDALLDISRLSGVTYLRLVGYSLSREDIQLIDLNTLRSLHISDCELPDRAFANVSAWQKLEYLELSGRGISESVMVDLPVLPSLNTLSISESSVRSLAPLALENQPSITNLYIVDTQIDDAGFRDLSKAGSLRSLDVSSTDITDRALKEVAALSNLEVFSAKSTRIRFHDTPTAWPNELAEILLDFCRIDDEGAKNLSKIRSLHDVNLTKTDITDAGLSEIAILQRLSKLAIVGTRCSQSGIDRLRKRHPRCEVQF